MRPLTMLLFATWVSLASMAPSLSAQRHSSQPRTVTLTATDAMKFSPSTISAKPGELIKIVLKAVGLQPPDMMSHNFVLLKPTANVAMFVMMASMDRGHDHMPPALMADVLASTSLASGGQTVTVTFKAPAKAGSYPYLCSFAGHYNAGMKGTLIVNP